MCPRLERGSVLRILDSKDLNDQQAILNSPKYSEYLNDMSKERLQLVLQGLDQLGIRYKLNDRLVRGLDYYCHTIFEFVASGKAENLLGRQQGTILAGGRYDGLVKLMGGTRDVSGMG